MSPQTPKNEARREKNPASSFLHEILAFGAGGRIIVLHGWERLYFDGFLSLVEEQEGIKEG